MQIWLRSTFFWKLLQAVAVAATAFLILSCPSPFSQAEQAFREALRINPQYLSAQVNLGNLLFLKKDYSAALAQYQRAHEALVRQGKGRSTVALKVLLNISKAHYQMEQYGEAESYYAAAEDIDPHKVAEYAYLAKAAGTDEARAAEGRDLDYDILFVEEE